MELISTAFRIAFRDYCSDELTLSTINNIFSGTGIRRGEILPERIGTFYGERRTLVEQHYASLDWTSRRDVEKFLKVLSNLLTLYPPKENHNIRKIIPQEDLLVEGNKVRFSPSKVSSGANVKNLIFAANGPKPEIVLIDALNNDIKIVKNEEYCLVYDKPISEHGLIWDDLHDWWNEKYKVENAWDPLHNRLRESLGSEPEIFLYETYYEEFWASVMPALIPQVYLHYDPTNSKQLSNGKRLVRQRMDFLLLLPNNVRVVIEIDGKQHYSQVNREGQPIAAPALYAEMVTEDRRLKLAGYEVYRFGGNEFCGNNNKDFILEFFRELFRLHSVEIIRWID